MKGEYEITSFEFKMIGKEESNISISGLPQTVSVTRALLLVLAAALLIVIAVCLMCLSSAAHLKQDSAVVSSDDRYEVSGGNSF